MRTLVVAPHPDDEVLGCGGTLLRRVAEGGTVGWLIVTSISEAAGWSPERVARRAEEIARVAEGLGIAPEHVFPLGFAPSELDRLGAAPLVAAAGAVFRDFAPEEVFVPFPGDAHSDHRLAFEMTSACTKWFRYPSVRRVLAYETPSETDFGIDPRAAAFRPNVFVDIGPFVERKRALLEIYASELGAFPFPRSVTAVDALARVRGAQAGFDAAEAFMLLRERA